ncbi:hypothetical protein ES707_04776 [subsurface metagenome]
MAVSISITAPSSAEEGEKVSVSVVVKNISERIYTFKTEIFAVPDLYPDYLIGSFQATIFSGDWKFYSASFTMPDCNTTVFVSVERWSFDHWVYDKSASKVVSLEIPVPETFHLSVSVHPDGYVDPGAGNYPAYSTVTLTARPLSGYQFVRWGGDASGTSPTFNLYMDSHKHVEAYFEKVPVPEPVEGTIIRKELEYSGSGDGTVPVVGVPQGVRAKLHVWGRNDMGISQGMGIYWFVADPDGMIAEEYTDWGGTIGAYPTDHEFISSGQFDLNKVGKYTTWIELLMGAQDDPEIVDRYIGDLCTVEAAVPEYRGKIIEKELEYDETRSIIPVY